MLTLIGVHATDTQLELAMETLDGLMEAAFPNDAAGMKKLLGIVLAANGPDEPAMQFVVGPAERTADCAALTAPLQEKGIACASVTQAALQACAKRMGHGATSGRTVILAFRQRTPG